MNWFLNLRTSLKLLASFGLLLLLLGATLTLALYDLRKLQRSERVLVERDLPMAMRPAELRADVNRQRAVVLEFLQTSDPAARAKLRQETEARRAQMEENLQRIEQTAANDQAAQRRLQEFKRVLGEFRQGRAQLFANLEEGKVEEARTEALGPQAERLNTLNELALSMSADAAAQAQKEVEASQAHTDRTITLFILLGILATIIGIALVAILNRMIASPLVKVSKLARQIAEGDLTVEVRSFGRTDEVGQMQQSFGRMIGSLRTLTTEIREMVNSLASSATEIMAASTQLASSAAETATAVTETIATVEEVKQTSQASNEKAKFVSDQAQSATEVAESGRRSVDETIKGMTAIREQMGAIASSILSLSTQGQAIGEIIATVDDLAAQSKLLAVNASIEAAKAGEEGKGFGVVAQEVKSLAEQSKQATTQVRNILRDIQKATSGAVLATEQGSKAVESGVRQSTEAGHSIASLATRVSAAAQASTQIAAMNQQQFVGMDQVALAMENINTASTQTVASTRQAETAAQQLHELGQRLKQVVSQFTV